MDSTIIFTNINTAFLLWICLVIAFLIITKEVNQIRTGIRRNSPSISRNSPSISRNSPWFYLLLCTHYGCCNVFQNIFENQKMPSFYGPNFETRFLLVTVVKLKLGSMTFFIFLIYMRRIYSPMYTSFRGVLINVALCF